MIHNELNKETLQKTIEEIQKSTLVIKIVPENLNIIVDVLKNLNSLKTIYTKPSVGFDRTNYIKLFKIPSKNIFFGKPKTQDVYDYFMKIINKKIHQGKILIGISIMDRKFLNLSIYHYSDYDYLKGSNEYIFLEDLNSLSIELKETILGNNQFNYRLRDSEIRIESIKKRTLKGE